MQEKLRKSTDALSIELKDKIQFMSLTIKELSSFESLDPMRKQKVDALSVVLRNILIDSPRQTSLLTAVGVAHKLFFKHRSPILSGKNNLYPESTLTLMSVRNNNLYFDSRFQSDSKIYINLEHWINEIVLDDKSKENYLVSRKEIILAIADKEAAHTDPDYDEKYYKISSETRMNINIEFNGVMYRPINNVYYESIITIAYEVIESFEQYNLFLGVTPSIMTLSNEYYLLHREELPKNREGYRINRWVSGHVKSGASALNIVNFTSDEVSSPYGLGFCQKYHYKATDVDSWFYYLDFSQDNNPVTLINNKEPFCLVAIIKGEAPTILTGSRVSSNSTLHQKYFLFPGKDWIIKESLVIRNDIYKIIGIPPIDGDL